MISLSLFAGIGGFDIGFEREGIHTLAHCEIDKYSSSVFKKHFPASQHHHDIKTLDAKQYQGSIALAENEVNRLEKSGSNGRGYMHQLCYTLLANERTHSVALDDRGTYKVRRLTPVECERLQGFPDGWTANGADGKPISDSRRYKMIGNAVTVNVAQAIAKNLVRVGL